MTTFNANGLRRLAAFLIVGALAAGCGGGGSSPAPSTTGGATGSTNSSLVPAPSPTGTPVATASLTIKFPADFHVAKLASGQRKSTYKAHANPKAVARRPAFVDPGPMNQAAPQLTVFVYDASINDVVYFTQPISVQGGTDGTQTVPVPLYSFDQQYVVAVESTLGVDVDGTQIIALGEADLAANSFSAGQAPTLALTMQMDTEDIGLTSDPNGASDAQAFEIGSSGNVYNYSGSEDTCSTPSTSPPLYAFATDTYGGYNGDFNTVIGPSGVGGIGIPTLTGYQSDNLLNPNTVTSGTTGSTMPYVQVTWNSTNTGVTFTFQVLNPAEAVYNDFLSAYNNSSYTPTYPGIYAVENYLSGGPFPTNDYLGLSTINIHNPPTARIDVQVSCD